MTARPLVSVLLPCRNAEGTLDEALVSIAEQSYEPLEVIVVDDGSTDRSLEIIESWGGRDDRFRAHHTPPLGIVSALNTAAGLAEGDLLARMDADDIASPLRFELQVELLQREPDLAACGTQVRYFPRSIVRDGARRYEAWINNVITPEEIDRDLFVECPIPHPTLLMRREAFEQVRGYRDVGWPEDYDLILRVRQSEGPLAKVPEVLLEWRESSNRLSRVNKRYSESSFRRCKAHFLASRTTGRSVVVCGAGPVGKAFALALKEEDQEIAAFVDLDPRKIGQQIHSAPVVHPAEVGGYAGCYFVAAVGSPKGRAEIREMLHKEGLEEITDYCAVA